MNKIYSIIIVASSLLYSSFVLKAHDKVLERYLPLPFGIIKPLGWLKIQMQKDMAGFVGNLDQLVQPDK